MEGISTKNKSNKIHLESDKAQQTLNVRLRNIPE